MNVDLTASCSLEEFYCTPKNEEASNPSYFSYYGQGPNRLGSVVSFAVTIKQLGTSLFYTYQNVQSCIAETTASKRVAAPGYQISSTAVHKFLESVHSRCPIISVHNFYLQKNGSMNKLTLNDIQVILDKVKIDASEQLSQYPIVIPVVIAGINFWEANHITLILIKDNCVEYYDPKGVVGVNRMLADGIHSFFDVLEYCKQIFTDNGEIVENPHTHQFDFHSCGIFACRHLDNRLLKMQKMGEFSCLAPSPNEIENYRRTILNLAFRQNDTQDNCIEDFALDPCEEADAWNSI